ncbi:MAG: divalent-cation tolerance protein CutA [Oligoflexia bacterium]|nr:divalent-cation tolerance protein CutA [Oligoflexia bacterium]
MNARLALVTCPNETKAREIAQELVQNGLAACVNILPGIVSIYRWKGSVETESECLMVIKTTKAKTTALEARILELHPYENPEFLALSPEYVTPKYLSWLES